MNLIGFLIFHPFYDKFLSVCLESSAESREYM